MKVAVVGATGLVGTKMLEDTGRKKFPGYRTDSCCL